MSFWLDRLEEAATYWPPVQHASGGVSYGAPQARACRWEDGSERVVDAQGREVRSTAVVTLDQDVLEDGKLYRGASVSANPEDAAKTIIRVDRIPRLRNPDEREVTAWL